MTRSVISRRDFVRVIGGAMAGACVPNRTSKAQAEAVWHPDRAGIPYRWIGMLSIGNRTACGFLISDRIVLTAAHVLYNPHPERRLTQWPPPPISFFPAASGIHDGRPIAPYGGFRVGKCLVCSEWFKLWKSGNPVGHSGHDWALLVLDRSPNVGNFGFKGDIEAGDRVDLIGYPGGIRPVHVQHRFSTTVRIQNPWQIVVSGIIGDSWNGVSGGPIFRWEGDEYGWCAIGITSRVEVLDGNSYHCRIGSQLLNAIKRYA